MPVPDPSEGVGSAPPELTHDDVTRLLELLDQSSFDYLEVTVGGTRVVAGKAGWAPPSSAAAPAAAAPPASAPAAVAPAAAPAPAPVAAPAPAAAPEPTEAGTEDGLITVTAPVVGTFYRAPQPGAEPFVEVGAQVREGDTLALVEVMKMINSVNAQVAGEVVAILADNGQLVEYGRPLVVLRPTAP